MSRGHRSAAGRAARRLHLLLLLSSIFRREGWNLLPSCLGTVPLPSLLPSAWLDKTLEPFPTRHSIAPGLSSPVFPVVEPPPSLPMAGLSLAPLWHGYSAALLDRVSLDRLSHGGGASQVS